MKEVFGWVEFFTELATRIDEAGPKELNELAKRIDWQLPSRSAAERRQGDVPLFGLDEIDPLTFFSYLATRTREPEGLQKALVNVRETFGVDQPVERCTDWRVLNVYNLLVAWARLADDRELLWSLFRQTVAGKIEADTFESVLRLQGVAIPTLSCITFLINPRSYLHLPGVAEYQRTYGVGTIPQQLSWQEYATTIKRISADYPGCDFCEIELFHRLQRGGGEAPPLIVKPDRCWVVSTNKDSGTTDLSTDFHQNCLIHLDQFSVRGGKKKPRPLTEPEPGHLVLLRFGRRDREHGRGIGVVCRNDYEKGWAPERGIHVLWLNKSDGPLETEGRKWQVFEEAGPGLKSAFRERPEYARTWEALDRMAAGSVGTKHPNGVQVERRYWLMSLGRRSSRWDACHESGLASIGFDEHPVGDLHKYVSLEEVGQAMKEVPGVDPYNTRLALWQFSHEMKPGDVIFVKRGQHDVIGHGTVKSQYRHVPTSERHKHVREVNWESNFPNGRRVAEQLVNKTLTDVTPYPDLVAALKSAVKFVESEADHPPNQILYGPPGTGKTYATVGHALAIIDGTDVKADIGDEEKRRFRDLGFEASDPSYHYNTEGRVAMVTFHQNYAYEDFVEGIRPKLLGSDGAGEEHASSISRGIAYELRHGIFRRICKAAKEASRAAQDEEQPAPRFVLIVDEINRGNIAKIFGELITLIEDSRRLGAKDETTATLPYSGDEFGVPDNLHIVGTMNTADRSIQQLDTALRRRFTFVEMMPDPDHELIPGDVDGVDCRKMLRAMNERIVLLMDREHQIGHTYLLDVKSIEDLADRFRNRIFPLLQEYFYDDWRRIDAVLGGNAFVQPTEIGEGYAKDLAREFDLVDEEAVTYERLPEHDPAWEDAGQYRKIYESVDAD